MAVYFRAQVFMQSKAAYLIGLGGANNRGIGNMKKRGRDWSVYRIQQHVPGQFHIIDCFEELICIF
jgi:hypothetical protein